MDFYIDLAFSVLLRVLKDRRTRESHLIAFAKLHARIEEALGDIPTFRYEVKERFPLSYVGRIARVSTDEHKSPRVRDNTDYPFP